MNPLFYMSEMAVSDLHGGGVTLQNILGETLDKVSRYVHLSSFAVEFPPTGRIRDRALECPMWAETQSARDLIGCRLCGRVSALAPLRRLHGRHVESRLLDNGLNPTQMRWLVCPQSDLSLYTIERFKKKGPVSYITWFMDDHLIRFNGNRWEYRREHRAAMQRHLQGARRVFVISPVLQDFYRSQFGVDSEVLFNPCDPVGEPVWDRRESCATLRFAYFGRVWLWQEDALARLAEFLDDGRVSLDVFSFQSRLPESLQRRGVTLRTGVPRDSVLHEMRKYDAIVLPIGFRSDLRHLSEFNIATKMSECLASGTITLAIGPEYSAMIRYLKPYNAAVTVTSLKSAEVQDALERIRDGAERRMVLENAQRLVAGELSCRAMRRKWLDGLACLG